MIIVKRQTVLGRPGSDLLSQVLRLSTIGAEEFNGRVRDGIGFRLPANTTRSAKNGNTSSPRVASAIADTRAVKWLKQAGLRVVLIAARTLRRDERIEDKSDQVDRAIRTGKLNTSRCLHIRPINVVVYHGSV